MLMCPNNYGHILRQKEGKEREKTQAERDRKTDKLSEGTNSTTW